MFHYTYCISHPERGYFYIGVRSSTVEPEKDHYMGSGTKLHAYYKKYPREQWIKDILTVYSSREEALEGEMNAVKMWRSNSKCLNLTDGGEGILNPSEETRRKLSERQRAENNSMYGKTHTPETRRKMSEWRRGENNPMYGKPHSFEHRRKLSESMKGKNKGIPQSDETRRKKSESLKGKNKGKVYLKKDGNNKAVKPEDLQSYLDQGWQLGRK